MQSEEEQDKEYEQIYKKVLKKLQDVNINLIHNQFGISTTLSTKKIERNKKRKGNQSKEMQICLYQIMCKKGEHKPLNHFIHDAIKNLHKRPNMKLDCSLTSQPINYRLEIFCTAPPLTMKTENTIAPDPHEREALQLQEVQIQEMKQEGD